MAFLLETERLILRKFNTADAGFVMSLLNSPGWLRYIGDRGIKTRADAEKYIAGLEDHHSLHGFGPMLVALKTTEEPLGMCSLIKRETLPHVDIGFAFLPEYNGKGYAFEASKKTHSYAKEALGLTELCAIVNSDNEASIQLLNKLGFSFVKEHVVEGEAEPLLFFSDRLKQPLP